jgi:hypothetical protein
VSARAALAAAWAAGLMLGALVGCTDSPLAENENSIPQGEVAELGPDGIARGFAVDPSEPEKQLFVTFYLDGPEGGKSAQFVESVKSQTGRGRHAFEYKLPARYRDGKEHLLYVYGLDTQAGASGALKGSPRKFQLGTTPKPKISD